MFTRTTGRPSARYRLPTRSAVLRSEALRLGRRAVGALCIALLLVSPMFADALLR